MDIAVYKGFCLVVRIGEHFGVTVHIYLMPFIYRTFIVSICK